MLGITKVLGGQGLAPKRRQECKMVLAVLPQPFLSPLFLLNPCLDNIQMHTSQPSYSAAKGPWAICWVSIIRNLGCTLFLHGLLSERVYDSSYDKYPLAKGISKCIHGDLRRVPLNCIDFQQAAVRGWFSWTYQVKQSRKANSKSLFNTSEFSTAAQPDLHTCAARLVWLWHMWISPS